MRWGWGLVTITAASGGLLVANLAWPERIIVGPGGRSEAREARERAERTRSAERKSENAKGVYMTSDVANDRGRAATKLRDDILALLETTELNAVVIDVKETRGGLIITDRLKELIARLHDRGAWVIARLVVFKDDSQEKAHPEWYLRRPDGRIWRDRRGGSWLDPASLEVWAYQRSLAEAASDAGFDEIQFDYIRFPSDGNVASIVYPVYDSTRPKYEVLRKFFTYLHDGLKAHRPELILSADLFGYVAIQHEDLGIGQRLGDIGENFDYISLMVYPSHYYDGFEVRADPARNLAALFYPYRASDVGRVAVNRPYDVVYRSILRARDVLEGRATTTGQSGQNDTGDGVAKAATTSPTSPPSALSPRRTARLRPWLQDFDLGIDTARGIRYDAAKVRAQIDAAEAAGASGWLLWSPDNVYTKEALKPES